MDITREEFFEILRNEVFENRPELLTGETINRQINKFLSEGLTLRQIARAVCYWYKDLGNDLGDIRRYGIGIVANIYEEADRFYEKKNADRVLKEQRIKMFEEYKKNNKQVVRIVKPTS